MRSFAVLLFFFVFTAAASARDLTRYAVILNDPPAVTVATRSDRAALDQARANVRGAHEAVKAELRTRGIRITGEADTLLNAIFVAADASQIDQIRTAPGVGYVVKMQRFHLALDAAVKLINVPAAWNLLGGSNAGAGVKIGIIDTGIESTHAAFQDSSVTPPAGFPVCPVMSDCAFTNTKIIVARSYVQMVAAGSGANPAADSRPDDYSARDRVGHGTAVAMAAAGLTNTGPADTITGVAPKAFLGNYKIFGSPGVNDSTTGDAIVSALEDAYNDGMDIVNLSLGAPAISGPLDTGATCGLTRAQICDPIAFAAQSAATATPGMIVVVAAGNAGANLGTLASPGDAPAAIGVAATTNSHTWSNAITVNGVVYQSQLGDGPVPASTLTGPLSDVASVGDPQACSAVPANSLSGTIALVQRGTCTFAVKVQNLQIAGAIGAIITNNPGDDTLLEPGGLGGTAIPAAFIGYDDGQTIRAYLQSHPNAPGSVNPNVAAFSVSTFNQVASFSSRGPVLGSGALKPDISAVGTDLYLTAQNYDPNGELYSADGYIVSQGTSFSTPQIAGIAALVKQAHPGLTVAQVGSAIIDTASQSVTDGGNPASLLAMGAGIANAGSAVTTNLVASLASVSLGIVKAGTLPMTQPIQLTNIGSAALNLSVSIQRRTTENNATTSINLPNVTIAAGQTGNVGLTLSGSVPSPGIYQGFLTIQGAANTIQIPYMYVVGDGVPAEIIAVAGDADTGIVGQSNSEGILLLQLFDQYGIAVQNAAVKFGAASGGGAVLASDSRTDNYGFGAAEIALGPVAGTNVFSATAGGLSTTFTVTSSYQPTISPNGSYNAANFQQDQPVAPGSLVSLFGANLSAGTQTFSTPYFPISLDGVSVSFDAGTLSFPGRLVYVSPGQVNIQVPWEMQLALQQGQTSVQVKVSIGSNSGALYNLPLGNYSPAFFEYPAGSVAAQDQNYNIVGTSNPVAHGTVVQLFVNGLGPVTNQPASGDPSPSNGTAVTPTTPVVMIGGQNAQVIFSGLAPGFAGLYQVNAVVPSVAAGVQPITISIGGVQSTTSHLAVK